MNQREEKDLGRVSTTPSLPNRKVGWHERTLIGDLSLFTPSLLTAKRTPKHLFDYTRYFPNHLSNHRPIPLVGANHTWPN